MYGCQYFVWNICEMRRMPIILIYLIIACLQIQNNLVVAADEQQQSQQIGKCGSKKKLLF